MGIQFFLFFFSYELTTLVGGTEVYGKVREGDVGLGCKRVLHPMLIFGALFSI